MNTARRFPFLGATSSRQHSSRLRVRTKALQGFLDRGEFNAASMLAAALIKEAPYDVRVLALCARSACAHEAYEDAIRLYDHILDQEDSDVIWAAKGRALALLEYPRRAGACFARAAALSGSIDFRIKQAECLRTASKLAEAMKVLKTVPPLSRNRAGYQLAYAKVLVEMGDSKAAYNHACNAVLADTTGEAVELAIQLSSNRKEISALSRQLAKRSTDPKVIAQIAKVFPEHISTTSIQELSALSTDPKADKAEKAAAHLALFRVHDTQEDRFKALAHLRKYHELSSAQIAGVRGEDSAAATFLTQLKFDPLRPSKAQVLPIFVAGLPGSGRQQAASILAQAAQCDAPRPLSLINAIMTRTLRRLRRNCCTELNRDDLLGIQAELRDGLCLAAGSAEVIIDTAPLNFRWSGLVAAALPEARIVHMKRDQMVTGWAIHNCGSDDPNLKCQHDLERICAFQERSAMLMAHWEKRFLSQVTGISGDALSRPGSGTARVMVEACQLKWSSSCTPPPYDPNRNWHHYASYLNPLRRPKNVTIN